MQILFVDTPEGAHRGPERGACSLAAVAMDLALPVTIVIPRPFAHPVVQPWHGTNAYPENAALHQYRAVCSRGGRGQP
jgi:hypothetical protein